VTQNEQKNRTGWEDLPEATELAWTVYSLLLLACVLPVLGVCVDRQVWQWFPSTVDPRSWSLSVGWTPLLAVVFILLLVSRSRLVLGLRGGEHLLLAVVVVGSLLAAVLTNHSSLLSIVPVFLLSLTWSKRAGVAVALLVSVLLGLKEYTLGDDRNLEAFLASAIVLVTTAFLVGGMTELTRTSLANARREAENLRRLVDNIPLGVCVLNEKGERVYANPLVGEVETRLIENRLSPAAAGKDGDGGPDGGTDEVEHEGQKFRVRFSRYLTPEGESSIAIVENMTEYLRLKEEARRASYLAAVGEMAAGVAHEIRNPLAGVSGYLQLLLEQDDEKKVGDIRRYAETAFEEIKALDRITRDFLKLATPQDTRKVPVDINGIVKGMEDMLGKEALRLQVRLSTAFAPDLPVVEADPGGLKQIILNLVNNAYQAAGKGGEVEIRTYRGPQDVFLEVRDNGPGIPEGLREKIFVPFFTTKDSGTGIGLSVSRRIALDHGGDIYFSSRPGETRFTFRIPTGPRPPGQGPPGKAEGGNSSPLQES